jgi:hypothetical protein
LNLAGFGSNTPSNVRSLNSIIPDFNELLMVKKSGRFWNLYALANQSFGQVL